MLAAPTTKNGNQATTCIHTLHQAGAPVGPEVIVAGVKSRLVSVNCTLLAENGGHIHFTKTWTQLLMICM